MRIFDVRPFYFGHRGDEKIWDCLRCISDSEYEILVQDIDSYMAAFFDSNAVIENEEKNWGRIINKHICNDKHDCLIDFNWWSEVAIPLLKERISMPETADCWKSKSETLEEMFRG